MKNIRWIHCFQMYQIELRGIPVVNVLHSVLVNSRLLYMLHVMEKLSTKTMQQQI